MMLTTNFLPYLFFTLSNCYLINGQNARLGERSVPEGITDFSTNMLNQLNIQAGGHNFILSTYSIWTLLAILRVGSAGETSSQISRSLSMPRDNNVLFDEYGKLQDELRRSTSDVELDLANSIFVDERARANVNFVNLIRKSFNVSVISLNFSDRQAVIRVDDFIRILSRGKIQHFLNYDDMKNAVMLLTTAIYFKGSWKLPFNRSATVKADFYDETLKTRLGQVDMMYQQGEYPLAKLSALPGHVVELPYGDDERYSMLVILPQRNVPIGQFLSQLNPATVESIFADVERSKTEFAGDEVIVYLPRFKIDTDLVLNTILEELGITNIFDPADADLSPIGENIYLSRVIHKAIIEVDEEGTVASAISGGTISYKSPPAVFNASHPFIFMIINTKTRTPLFVGKYSNPRE